MTDAIAYHHTHDSSVSKIFATAERVQMVGGDFFAVSRGGQSHLYAIVGDPMDMRCAWVATSSLDASSDSALLAEGKFLAGFAFDNPSGNAQD